MTTTVHFRHLVAVTSSCFAVHYQEYIDGDYTTSLSLKNKLDLIVNLTDTYPRIPSNPDSCLHATPNYLAMLTNTAVALTNQYNILLFFAKDSSFLMIAIGL